MTFTSPFADSYSLVASTTDWLAIFSAHLDWFNHLTARTLLMLGFVMVTIYVIAEHTEWLAIFSADCHWPNPPAARTLLILGFVVVTI